jgi:hypothetical protein
MAAATAVWGPEHDAAARQVQRFVETTNGPVILTADDAWRWCTALLVDAEYNLDLARSLKDPQSGALQKSTLIVGADRARRAEAAAAGGIWPPTPETGRFGPIDQGQLPTLMYLAPSAAVRGVYRGSRWTTAEPTFRSFGAPDPQLLGVDINLAVNRSAIRVGTKEAGGNALRLGPLVVIVIGVVAVAAMAAAGYVGGEYVKKNVEVDKEKARFAAEANLKLQIAMAQMAAGKPVKLDDAIISAARSEESVGWKGPLVLAGAGAVAGGLGVVAWRGRKQRPTS